VVLKQGLSPLDGELIEKLVHSKVLVLVPSNLLMMFKLFLITKEILLYVVNVLHSVKSPQEKEDSKLEEEVEVHLEDSKEIIIVLIAKNLVIDQTNAHNHV
jgi:hypothetical protein